MDYVVERRRRFGQHLELAGPGWEQRANDLGLAAANREALQREFGGRLVRIGIDRAAIVEVLGPPDWSDSTRSCYDLGVRAEHDFAFSFSPRAACLIEAMYVRKQNLHVSQRALTLGLSGSGVARSMVPAGTTAAELLDSLGEPSTKAGWWPFETWCYPEGLVFELRLGVVDVAT